MMIPDETGATTKMTRFYGRAPEGERLVEKVPHGHWKTTTFICGLRYNGVTAPFVVDGAMDGPHFLAYVEQILAPTLKILLMASKKQSRPAAPASIICRHTAQTLTPLNNSSPSSKHFYAK